MPELIKPKRGRKSKKDLLNQQPNMSILINEIENKKDDNGESIEITTEENIVLTSIKESEQEIELEQDSEPVKPVSKKRGRKPKGGKIIQQVTASNNLPTVKPNIILHLKCSLKDLVNTSTVNSVESYNFAKGDLFYNIISAEPKKYANINEQTEEKEDQDHDECADSKENDTKELWKKIKQLEHNLHINNINDKKSACFWCTYEFDNPAIYIPKYFIKNSYHVYGCFCSPECGVAYLMEENIDSSTKFERYHFINHLYGKVCNYTKNIKPAPNPYYMLDKYYGNLSIQEYRSLFKNERLFLIVDKPLTRILPELHEDNDDFILNNKIIPSNNYQVKKKLQRKTQNKTTILNEKFGITN